VRDVRLWTITWLGDTRERFKELVRRRVARWRIPEDAGDLAAKRVEEDISMHPIPSCDSPQFERDGVFEFKQIQVYYHISSARRKAEVRNVYEAA
jgi:hypothetical protein